MLTQYDNSNKKTQMKALTIFLTASALAFGGCASGAKFSDYAVKLPPPKQEEASPRTALSELAELNANN